MPDKDTNKFISRRGFLIKSGWVAAGLTVTAIVSYPYVRAALPALPTFSDPELEDAFAWIQVLPGGRIRFYCPRMEMGQGASLGLSQVVAEELNIDQSQIECVVPDTDQTPPFKMTVGSESISYFFNPVSYGAALLRERLRNMAAQQAGVAPDQIQDGQGGFILPDATRLDYAMLVPSAPVVLSASDIPASQADLPRYALQRKGKFQSIGRGWKHPELEEIVTGKTVYSRDVTVPDMVYGQIIRPPAFAARLQSVDASAAEAMPGVIKVVIDQGNNFVGVVTGNPFILAAAIEACEVRWQAGEDLNQDQIDAELDVERLRAEDDFEHTLVQDGSIDAGRNTARHRLAARYDTPFAAHAAMEPRAGVARVSKGKVEIWCGSQDPFFVQRQIAKLLGRAVEEVVVYSHRMGGGFGGRIPCQAAEEAALLSAAVERPVRVLWDRETEFQNNYLHPAFSHYIDAGVTETGKISHWQHDFVSAPIATGPVPNNIAWAVDMVVADFGTSRGSIAPYFMENRHTRYSDIRTAVPIGAWRGLGAAPNAFAIESMMDELAAKAGIDPVEFRLLNLPPRAKRLAQVLRQVAGIAKWGQPVATDTGRGVACAVYKDETAAAVIAEVHIDHEARKLQVTKTWCVQDCGLIINPNQVENMIMGNIVWGCSMALKEQITIAAGSVEENNFDGYELLRHAESPEMTVALVDSDAAPVGVGESALGPVAPAITNAVFAATGRRARRLPVNYDTVFSDTNS